MRIPLMISGAIAALLMPLAAQAQRPPVAETLELLGEQSVGFQSDNDSIVINQDEEWFRNRKYRSLQFAVERNDIEFKSIRLIYINGFVEDFDIGKKIRKGTRLTVDLRGERSFLKQIDMRYRSEFGISIGGGGLNLRVEPAIVKVYGERVQRRPETIVEEPPVVERGGWSLIDTQRFDSGASRVVLSSGRGDGKFGQIRLKAVADAVRIRDVTVRFRNGETQSVPIDSRLEAGDETRAIDLYGDTRFIDTVTVNLEPRRRPGRPELQLLALRRPGAEGGGGGGDPYTQRGWTLLGEQTVGFRAERDVIDVKQGEDWYRDRRFRSLHLIAQRNDIYMRSVRIVYMNDHVENFNIDRLLPAGTDSEIDLRGERSFIRRIEMVYRARPNFNGQAVMKVYGEPARR